MKVESNRWCGVYNLICTLSGVTEINKIELNKLSTVRVKICSEQKLTTSYWKAGDVGIDIGCCICLGIPGACCSPARVIPIPSCPRIIGDLILDLAAIFCGGLGESG
jgi:hypothetical protein